MHALFVIFIILIIILILYTKYYSRNGYAVMTSDGFKGAPISTLKQPKEFYDLARSQTLKYLVAVYPAAKDTLENMTSLELASFYNSLWFYFNCAGEYIEDDLGELINPNTGKGVPAKWGPLPCAKEMYLPYTPQGWLYNFYTYHKFNVPEINSNSDPNITYLQVKNASSNRAGVMGAYQDRNTRNSGIMWINLRTILRDIWYPNGLRNDKRLDFNVPDNWLIQVGSHPRFDFPTGWFGGFKSGQYIEVTHSPTYTGDAINMSPFWWYNACVGSGLFLALGKTLAVKNKISGIFIQAQLLAKSCSGRATLKKWFGSTDPYTITWGVVGLCGFNSQTGQTYCDFSHLECGNACNPNPIGYLQAAGLKNSIGNFYQETIKYQKNILKINQDVPTAETIRKVVDLAVYNKHYGLAHVAEHLLADEVNFFLGLHLELDTLQFYEDPNGNDNYVFEIIDLRIPNHARAAAKNRDYSGFMDVKHPGARPIVMSDGTWADPNAARNNSYLQTAIQEYLTNAYTNNWLSIRDPFDIYNEDKVLKCNGTILSKVCGDKYANTMYCEQLPFLNAYKCLALGNEFTDYSCQLTGENPTC